MESLSHLMMSGITFPRTQRTTLAPTIYGSMSSIAVKPTVSATGARTRKRFESRRWNTLHNYDNFSQIYPVSPPLASGLGRPRVDSARHGQVAGPPFRSGIPPRTVRGFL